MDKIHLNLLAMAYLSNDKSIYLQTNSSIELVDQLRSLSQLPATVSYSMFMTQFAVVFKIKTQGLLLRTDTTDHFITDLVGYGWIKIVQDL